MTDPVTDPAISADFPATGRIAFQGELGANSHEACVAAFPDMEPVPHAAFEEAFDAVKAGDCSSA